MKLVSIIIIIFIIILVISIFIITNNKINFKNIVKNQPLTYTEDIPSSYDFKTNMDYYFSLGISIRDNNLVTIDDTNQLRCLDEFYSSNTENNTVKIKNCSNDSSQSFQIKRMAFVDKLYSSSLDRCLTNITNSDGSSILKFRECKTNLDALQEFKIIDDKIAYIINGNPTKWLSFSQNKEAILIDNKNEAPHFQFLNFNQKCNSNVCTNLTSLTNNYLLLLDTSGILKLLKQTINTDFTKTYKELWNNSEELSTKSSGKYNIAFDSNGILRVRNITNNSEIWNTELYTKTNEYNNKLYPYSLEIINDMLVVLDGKNEIMYTIFPHPEIRNCKLDSLTETLCYNNNVKYRANVIDTPLGNGINCVDTANTSYGYSWDISETVQTLIPFSNITQKFVYRRNEKCTTDVPFIQLGNFSDDSLYYNNYYYQLVTYDKPYSERVIILCYNDYDDLIGIKIQSNNDFYVSQTDKLEDIQTLFLYSSTIITSETTLIINNNNNRLEISVINLIVTITLTKNGVTYNPFPYKLDNLLKTDKISKVKCLDIDNKYRKIIKQNNNVIACSSTTGFGTCLEYDSIEKCESITYDTVDDVKYKNVVPFMQSYSISNQNVSLTFNEKFIVPRYIHTIHQITFYFTYKIITTINSTVTRFSPIYLRLKHNNEVLVNNIEISNIYPVINTDSSSRRDINPTDFPKILKYRNKELTLEIYTSNNNPQNNFIFILTNGYLEIYYRKNFFKLDFTTGCRLSELNNTSHWCNKASLKFDN
jgi:hypothetical protein